MKKIHNYAINPDKITMGQFENCTSQGYVVEAALMPDAHAGYAAPIGSVLITKKMVVPAWVGFDIGCGMTSAKIKGTNFKEIKEKARAIYNKVKKKVPMGMGEINRPGDITEESKKAFDKILKDFESKEHDPKVLQFFKGKAIRHIGSLGDGNHFIELGSDNNKDVWITVHSGSRGVGYKVAEKYMKKSAGKNKQFEATYPLDVSNKLGKEYLNVLDFGLAFALQNRLEMINKTLSAMQEVLGKKLTYKVWTNKNHNHAIKQKNKFVHRKGATPAMKGEKGVIPANMRDGCFLVEGKGNKNFLQSSSHGAGRVLSRKDSLNKLKMDDFKKSMKGIVGTVTEGTLDEAPMAYKNIYDVMEAQKNSIKVIRQLKPIINWKGERRRAGKKKSGNN